MRGSALIWAWVGDTKPTRPRRLKGPQPQPTGWQRTLEFDLRQSVRRLDETVVPTFPKHNSSLFRSQRISPGLRDPDANDLNGLAASLDSLVL
jgi:hypothetical protein